MPDDPAADGSLRPRVHLTPPSGWLNDPNGMILDDGRLHLFYQHEPDAPHWGTMRWAHASSRDLLAWDHHPIALAPSPGGPDAFGCWSGCIVRDADGIPIAFYTGVVIDGEIRRASICRAVGDPSLERWIKAPQPVIPGPPPGIAPDCFRDPFVWLTATGWAMAVGAGTVGGQGTLLLYRSADLETWTYDGQLLTTEALIAACPDLDVAEIDSTCWECPQLVQLEDLNCLIISIVDRSPVVRPAHVVAVTGQLLDRRFVPFHAERLGLGPDFYAPATLTLPDSRVVLFGWIPEDPPGPGDRRDWAGAMTLPRVVSLADDGSLRMTLADEVEELGPRVVEWTDVTVLPAHPWRFTLPGAHAELRLEIEPRGAPLRLDVLAGDLLVAEVRFDPRSLRLSATRNSRVGVAGLSPTGAATMRPSCAERLDLRLIVDGTVVELVAADVVTATVRLPAVEGSRTIAFTTFGGPCRIGRAEVRAIEPRPALQRVAAQR